MDSAKFHLQKIRKDGWLRSSQKQSLQVAEKVFDEVDLDGDGFLNREEALKAYARLDPSLEKTKPVFINEGPIHRDQFILWWFTQKDVFGQAWDPDQQVPPGMLRRFFAGATDALWASYLPLGVAHLVFDDLHPVFPVGPVGVGIAMATSLLYCSRDLIGSRSPGKKLFGLEIVQIERKGLSYEPAVLRTTSIPATRRTRFIRGCIEFTHNDSLLCGVNVSNTLPTTGMLLGVAELASPWGLVLFTPTRQSVPDYICSTMVVPEGPLYDQRVEHSSRGLAWKRPEIFGINDSGNNEEHREKAQAEQGRGSRPRHGPIALLSASSLLRLFVFVSAYLMCEEQVKRLLDRLILELEAENASEDDE